jgi:hypothetical protein
MPPPHDEHPHDHVHEHPELQPQRAREMGEDPSEAQPEVRETDLLSLGLLVFFVALIAVVGALLAMPALF